MVEENKTLANKVTVSSIGTVAIVARYGCLIRLNFANVIFIRDAKYQAGLDHQNSILPSLQIIVLSCLSNHFVNNNLRGELVTTKRRHRKRSNRA